MQKLLYGILISVVMMGAMFTSYTVVNNTYSQVTDRAKISTAGRDVVGMIMRDIRNAGFMYFNDNIKTSNEHIPILITKYVNFSECDKIDIVYGDVNYKQGRTPAYIYERYKITYKCKKSTIPDKTQPQLGGGGYPPIDAFAVYKKKVKWNNTSGRWDNPTTDNFMLTTNLNIGLWKWIEGYLDLGMLKDKGEKSRHFYGTGLRLNLLPDFFELYFPISSSNGFELSQKSYSKKIDLGIFTDTSDLKHYFKCLDNRMKLGLY